MNTGPYAPDTTSRVITLPDMGPPTHPRFLFDPCDIIIDAAGMPHNSNPAPDSAVFSRGVSLGMMTTRRVAESAASARCTVNRHFVAVCAVALAWSVPADVESPVGVVMDRRFSGGRGAHRRTVWALPRFWGAVDARTGMTDESLSAAMRALFAAGQLLVDNGAADGMTIPWLREPWDFHRGSATVRRSRRKSGIVDVEAT